MSLYKAIDVFCDGPPPEYGGGCVHWVGGNGAETASEAREEAKKKGWTKYRGRDLCPTCKAKLEELLK